MFCNSFCEEKGDYMDGNNCIESVDYGDKKYYYEEGSTINKECVNDSTCEDLITGKKKTSISGISQTLNKMESSIENCFLFFQK